MNYKTIFDEEFQHKVTLGEAYQIMWEFIRAFDERGTLSTQELCNFTELGEAGDSSDPAQVYDFLNAVKKVCGDQT